METIICDRSAFLYWRTPPIARLLASGPEDDPLLRHIMDADGLGRLRSELRTASSPFDRASGSDRRRAARLGGAGLGIVESSVLLATGFSGPVDVLVRDAGDRRPSGIVRPRVWSGELPAGSLGHIGGGVDVVSPVLSVQQMAARTTPGRVALMLSELMGSFSVYEPRSRWLRRCRTLRTAEGFRRTADGARRATTRADSPAYGRALRC